MSIHISFSLSATKQPNREADTYVTHSDDPFIQLVSQFSPSVSVQGVLYTMYVTKNIQIYISVVFI